MGFLNGLIFIFYNLLTLLVGMVFVGASLGIITLEDSQEIICRIYQDGDLRLYLGASGLLVILISFGVIQLAVNRMRRGKGIILENADGQISISFSAIEHFVKRLFKNNLDIKDLKAICRKRRKNIEVICKVCLWQNARIPEVTEKMQAVIKSKLQQLLGIEEPIAVKINVFKIATKETAGSQEEPDIEPDIEPPYQYRD